MNENAVDSGLNAAETDETAGASVTRNADKTRQVKTVRQLKAVRQLTAGLLFLVLFSIVIIAGVRSGASMELPVSGAVTDVDDEPSVEPEDAALEGPEPEAVSQPEADDTSFDTDPTYMPAVFTLNGEYLGTLASMEAAQQLMEDIRSHYLSLCGKNAVITMPEGFTYESNVRAKADTTAGELFDMLTGEATPLTVICTVTSEEHIELPFDTKEETSKYLVKGTRLVVSSGRTGERVVETVVTYINGVPGDKETVRDEIIREPVDDHIITGTQKVSDGEPGKREGEAVELPEGISLVSPVKGSIAKNFGQADGVMHLGVDYVPKDASSPVTAAGDGIVVCIMERGSYGLMLEIDHGQGVVTRYAQLGEVTVSVGDTVKQGDPVALLIMTAGADTGFHFEVRVHSVPVNPRFCLD